MKSLIVAILVFGNNLLNFLLKKTNPNDRVANLKLDEYSLTKQALIKAITIFELCDRYENMPVATEKDLKRRNAYKKKIKAHRKIFWRLLARE